MDVEIEEKVVVEAPFKIRKKPLAKIVSMVLNQLVGFYVEDENGNQLEIGRHD